MADDTIYDATIWIVFIIFCVVSMTYMTPWQWTFFLTIQGCKAISVLYSMGWRGINDMISRRPGPPATTWRKAFGL
jgi:hypothetical protein